MGIEEIEQSLKMYIVLKGEEIHIGNIGTELSEIFGDHIPISHYQNFVLKLYDEKLISIKLEFHVNDTNPYKGIHLKGFEFICDEGLLRTCIESGNPGKFTSLGPVF